MKTTKQNIITARENRTEVEILLTNGKKMFVDFADNTICRFSAEKGVEQQREFNADTNKMFKLALTYLTK
tara:strand:- start:204 stop:413 length:210 start_codon:yes stop_codon:yes gene_type:complete